MQHEHDSLLRRISRLEQLLTLSRQLNSTREMGALLLQIVEGARDLLNCRPPTPVSRAIRNASPRASLTYSPTQVKSTPGQGSTFIFTLPLEPPP